MAVHARIEHFCFLSLNLFILCSAFLAEEIAQTRLIIFDYFTFMFFMRYFLCFYGVACILCKYFFVLFIQKENVCWLSGWDQLCVFIFDTKLHWNLVCGSFI